ncbi:hypothetical protein OG590_24475 [Streptomyces goshikiensis]|uniref:hypothetical protein n=1 Tax=Streptomyces TaxID=1883 RepID=UPI000F5544DB|nr:MULTISPECIES: hypothetical protein [Streptomyces]RPK52602.1 LysE type translocator [Streptomyces sp. ADI91-18]WSR98850.1 hypothetical protein OG224_12670 [Streptomyces goshikiensis]WSY00118.1 hypothetical protein OG590_24475 [Streptomyces goshikiensis]
MSELLAPALSGAAAGLGVAMPMGAMSVLLLQEAIRERRAAVAAAAGVAAVDLGYAALATALGPWVAAHVTPAEAWIRLAASAILLTIATRGLLPTRPAPPPTNAAPAVGASAGAGRVFARYVGLTAVNPTTALYFAALTTAQGAALRAGAAGVAFVTGVALASLLWQQALVALGALAGSRISPAARAWTFRLGYGLVAAYALKIAFPLP